MAMNYPMPEFIPPPFYFYYQPQLPPQFQAQQLYYPNVEYAPPHVINTTVIIKRPGSQRE